MSTLISIITDIILPIFILIAIGYVSQKKLHMDVRTFTKLNIYIFIPTIIFTKIYRAEATWQLFSTVLIYLAIIFIIMLTLGEVIARLLRYPRPIRKAFINSLLFFNGGNYGLPLVELAFQSTIATTAQIFIMLIQNTLSNTFGVFQASSGRGGNKEAFKNVLTMPALYVLILVAVVKALHIVVPDFLMIPLESLSGGFIPIALITLGVQLAEVKVSTRVKDILISSSIRLVVAPILGFFLVQLMGVEGVLAKSLIIGISTPTAVNMAIIAKEFNNEPEYASQIVFVSTVLSVITISALIYLLEFI